MRALIYYIVIARVYMLNGPCPRALFFSKIFLGFPVPRGPARTVAFRLSQDSVAAATKVLVLIQSCYIFLKIRDTTRRVLTSLTRLITTQYCQSSERVGKGCLRKEGGEETGELRGVRKVREYRRG